MSEYMLHEASLSSDSGYHSPHNIVPANLDASSGTMVPHSVSKVPCPFSQGETLVNIPSKTVEILPQLLCEDTGHPDGKVPGQVLPLASTLRVSRENLTNVAIMSVSFGELETAGEPDHPIPCNSIPTEEKVLPSPVEFPAQSTTESHPIGVDGDLEDYVCQAPMHVQHTSTHNPAIVSPDVPLNWPRLVLMAKGQPQ